MPATSKPQAVAARIALAAKKHHKRPRKGTASASMAKMSIEDLEHFTHESFGIKTWAEFLRESLLMEDISPERQKAMNARLEQADARNAYLQLQEMWIDKQTDGDETKKKKNGSSLSGRFRELFWGVGSLPDQIPESSEVQVSREQLFHELAGIKTLPGQYTVEKLKEKLMMV